MREECPFANEGCKYFDKTPPPELNQEHGCFRDEHHPYFPKEVIRMLGREVVRMNNEKVEMTCRQLHDRIHSTVPFNLPTYTDLVVWKRDRQGQSNGIQTPDRR